MPKYHRFLSTLCLMLPLTALAQAPIIDSNSYQVAQASGGSYAGGGSTPTSAQGMLFNQLEQMQREISQLRGMLEEQQNEISTLKQQSLERYQDLDGRLSGASAAAPAKQQGASSSSSSAQSAATAATAAAAGSASAGSTAAGDPEKEKLYYDAAFDLVRNKDFPKAAQAFNAFLGKYPNGQYSANAQYWLGEVYLIEGNLQESGKAFARVAKDFPSHSKVPDALFKLASVEKRLGNNDKSRGILQQIVAQYPGTSAAQLAQRDLNAL